MNKVFWISVNDSLPTRRDEFLVTLVDGDVTTAWFVPQYGIWQGYDVVAWTEKPAPWGENETSKK